jgi:WD40 repeat protein
LKFDPNNPNILYSGSWDCYILVNDLREKKRVGEIFGPYVCGESIDVKDSKLVVGSYKSDSYLSLYDLKTCNKIQDICW